MKHLAEKLLVEEKKLKIQQNIDDRWKWANDTAGTDQWSAAANNSGNIIGLLDWMTDDNTDVFLQKQNG